MADAVLSTSSRPATQIQSPPKKRKGPRDGAGMLFVLPGVLGLLLFSAGPLAAAFYLSFTSYDILNAPQWIGFDNYTRAFTSDDQFWPSIRRTFLYVLMEVPIGIVLSLLLAVLLNQNLKGTRLFRTLFFLPSITPAVAAIFFWIWMFNPYFGPINYGLGEIGIWGPDWLQSTDWALPSLAIIGVWASAGGTRMVIFLAGLQGIPQDLYDAASIDGAGPWQRFINITVPLLSPTIFFVTVLSIINALKVFTAVYIGTDGGPAYATWVFGFHLFKQAFQFFQMGYASALGWIFFVVILAFTLIQFRLQSKWVHYEGAD